LFKHQVKFNLRQPITFIEEAILWTLLKRQLVSSTQNFGGLDDVARKPTPEKVEDRDIYKLGFFQNQL